MTPVTLLLESRFYPHHLPLLHAREHGIFEEHDLKVTWTPSKQGSSELQPLLEKEVEFAFTTPLTLISRSLRGQPLTGLARVMNTDNGILYSPENQLASPESLTPENRVLLNHVDRELATILLQLYIDRSEGSLDAETLEYRETNGDPVESFRKGTEDLMIIAGIHPEGIQLQQMEHSVDFWFFSDFDLPSCGDLILAAHRSYLDEHPNQVQRFLQALFESITDIQQQPDTARGLYREFYIEQNITEPIQALLEMSLSKLTRIFSQNLEAYTEWGSILSREDRMGGFLDLDQLVDERYLPLDSIHI